MLSEVDELCGVFSGVFGVMLTEKFNELVGVDCTNFRLIFGGSLILCLGPEQPSGEKRTRWRLHLEPSWRLEQNGIAVIGSLDTMDLEQGTQELEVSLKLIGKLIGTRVTRVTFGAPVLDLTISFDDSFVLRTFTHSRLGDENWELRREDGYRLAMKSPGEWREWMEQPDPLKKVN